MDKFKKHACDFKNEAECQEELEEEGTTLGKAEREHFEEAAIDKEENTCE